MGKVIMVDVVPSEGRGLWGEVEGLLLNPSPGLLNAPQPGDEVQIFG